MIEQWHLWAAVLVQIVSTAGVVGVIYGGIRSDLSSMKDAISSNNASVNRAHVRIDDLLSHHK